MHRSVAPDQVVVGEVERDSRPQILHLFAERVREPCEPALRHTECEILALHVGP